MFFSDLLLDPILVHWNMHLLPSSVVVEFLKDSEQFHWRRHKNKEWNDWLPERWEVVIWSYLVGNLGVCIAWNSQAFFVKRFSLLEEKLVSTANQQPKMTLSLYASVEFSSRKKIISWKCFQKTFSKMIKSFFKVLMFLRRGVTKSCILGYFLQ